ncbi:MAG: energy transducer TonB [Bacteroidota bacterium]
MGLIGPNSICKIQMAKSKNFIPKPVYPGGSKAMNAFVKKHLKYPESAKKAKIEGTVRVNYSLDQSGRVIKVKAVEGPKEGGLREEAERVVKMLKFDVPKERKMRVQYHQHLDVNFKLPKPKPKSKVKSTTKISYTIKPASKTDTGLAPSGRKESQNDRSNDSTSTYSYIINW